MSEQELIDTARSQQVKVYGLSRYYSSLPAETEAGTLLLGVATLKISEIPDLIGRLKKAWLTH